MLEGKPAIVQKDLTFNSAVFSYHIHTNSRAALYQPCAVFDTRMKFSTQNNTPGDINFFNNSATLDLTFGDLYNHFCVENSAFLFISAWGII